MAKWLQYYIGGGSSETPKSDYVIYGWPLNEVWEGEIYCILCPFPFPSSRAVTCEMISRISKWKNKKVQVNQMNVCQMSGRMKRGCCHTVHTVHISSKDSLSFEKVGQVKYMKDWGNKHRFHNQPDIFKCQLVGQISRNWSKSATTKN